MTKITKKGQETKQAILRAAKTILLNDGIGALSVEAVCTAVGLSKGSFFYHFKTREELLKDLLVSLTEHQTQLFEKFSAEDQTEYGRGLRSYIRAMLSMTGKDRDNARAACRCMMEMLLTRTDMLNDFGMKPGFYEDLLLSEEMTNGLSPKQALLALLACEGLWYDQSLGVQGIHTGKIQPAIDAIIEMTYAKDEDRPRF